VLVVMCESASCTPCLEKLRESDEQIQLARSKRFAELFEGEAQ
jgi:hypothetical protein